MERTVDFDALWRYLHRLRPGPTPDKPWTYTAVAKMCGVSKQAVFQWAAKGINPWRADQIAVELKTHPWVIWGEAWEAACIADETAREKSLSRTLRKPWQWPEGYTHDEQEMAA